MPVRKNEKVKIIRLVPQGVQVPEITYTKDGKRIVIQGAIHIADRKFYENIIDKIKGFSGETHLEGIINTDPQYENEKILLNSVYEIMSAYGNIAYQKDYINKNLINDKKVFNYDFTDVELGDTVFNEEILNELKQLVKNFKNKLSKSNTILNIGSSPLFNVLISSIGISGVSLNNENVILHQRNKFAIDQALNTDNDVFLFWGTKHIEGMNDLLLEEGFTIEKARWKTAIRTLRLKKNHQKRKELIQHRLNIIEQVLSNINR